MTTSQAGLAEHLPIPDPIAVANANEALHDGSHPEHSNAVNALAVALSGDSEADAGMTEMSHNASSGVERLDEMLSAGMMDAAVASDYDFSRLNLPDGEAADPVELNEIADLAWSAEIPKALVSGLSAQYGQISQRTDEEREHAYRQTRESLIQKYGEDKVEPALKLAYSAAFSAGGQQAIDFLDNSGIGNDFSLVVHLIEFAKRKGAAL
jgi:hypothetical protein